MSKEQTRPSESLVQELLTERRELKVAVERLKIELADAQASGGAGPSDSRVKEMQDEIERLRYQLASSRAEAAQVREDRDEVRPGLQRAQKQISAGVEE